MFTGLIQTTGVMLAMERRGQECRMTIRPETPFSALEHGESIACNGACLSVERFDAASFTVYASTETMTRTNLGSLSQGSVLNLERALRLGDRLGGHIVSGHVDCLAEVVSVRQSGQSVVVAFAYPAEFAAEVAPKGSVCLDGISLTVNGCAQGELGKARFDVNIIPDTQERTSMRLWKPGYRANMETDVLAKYVKRLLAFGAGASGSNPPAARGGTESGNAGSSTIGSSITLDFLASRGFV